MKKVLRTTTFSWLSHDEQVEITVDNHEPTTEVCSSASVFAFTPDGKVAITNETKRGYWDIPGGRIDSGETVRETAIRELYEETAVCVHRLNSFGYFKIIHRLKERPKDLTYPFPVAYIMFYWGIIDTIDRFIPHEENSDRKIISYEESLEVNFFKENKDFYDQARSLAGFASNVPT